MAVALASELRRVNSSVQILFVGTRRGVEKRALEPLGFELRTIHIGGLKGVGLLRTLQTLVQLPAAFMESLRIIRQFHPSIVVGVGGYSAGPVMAAGKLQGVPSLLVEPNLLPGLTNRMLGRWVDRAAVAFEETAACFGAKARITGIPVRPEFHRIRSEISSAGRLRVLVFGGSQGSRAINNLMCEALRFLDAGRFHVIHQTGAADYQRVSACYARAGFQARITEFIDEMPDYFAGADLILSRAGASTVAEITAAGRPAVLIPFPHAADDHQRQNARALAERRAALLLEEETASGQKLADLLMELERDRERLRRMAAAGKALARPRSTQEIIALMEELVKGCPLMVDA